jgi:hypothetical protein
MLAKALLEELLADDRAVEKWLSAESAVKPPNAFPGLHNEQDFIRSASNGPTFSRSSGRTHIKSVELNRPLLDDQQHSY